MKKFSSNVFIHVDTLRRDAPISCLIKNVLEKMGYNVFLTSRRNVRLLSISFFTKIFKPSSIILSHVPGSFTKDELHELSKRSNLFLLMPEGFFNDIALEKVFPLDFDHNLFSAIFVWGEYTKKWLIKNRNISEDKIVVAGFHRFDLYGLHDNFIGKSPPAKTSKKHIGFIGRLGGIDVFDKRSIVRSIVESVEDESKGISHLNLVDEIRDEASSFFLYVQIFDYIYHNTDYMMSYRPHPNENVDSKILLKSRYKDRFLLSAEEDYNSWILSQDVIISPTSTSYVDAYILGKPVISIDRIINASKANAALEIAIETFNEYAYAPSTFEELIDLLLAKDLKPRKSEKTQDILRDYYDWPRDNYSTVDIVKTVMKHDSVKKHNIGGKLLIKFLSIADYCFFTLRRLRDKNNLEVRYNYNSYYHKYPEYIKKLSEKIVARLKSARNYKASS